MEDNSKFKALSAQLFERHLKYFLSSGFKPCSVSQLVDSLKNGLNNKTVTITFDDGLKSQFTNAFPLLEEYNFPACFFLTTKNLTENTMNNVHKIHLLMSEFSIDQLAKEWSLITGTEVERNKELVPKYWDDVFTANLKFLLRSNSEILDKIFNKKFDEKNKSKKFYINFSEAKKLLNAGMEIGCHSHSHMPLAEHLAEHPSHVRDELAKNKNILEKELDINVDFVSYPRYEPHLHIESVAKSLGFIAGFTTIKKMVASSDDLLSLGRFDANHVTEMIK